MNIPGLKDFIDANIFLHKDMEVQTGPRIIKIMMSGLARNIGKTTTLLEYVKEHESSPLQGSGKVVYISANAATSHTVRDKLIDMYYKLGATNHPSFRSDRAQVGDVKLLNGEHFANSRKEHNMLRGVTIDLLLLDDYDTYLGCCNDNSLFWLSIYPCLTNTKEYQSKIIGLSS